MRSSTVRPGRLRGRRAAASAAVLVAGLAAFGGGTAAAAERPDPASLRPLPQSTGPDDSVPGGAAQKALVPVIVKLGPASLAAYRGGRSGLPATSPRVTGKKLAVRSRAARRYLAYLAQNERTVAARIRARVPDAQIGRSLRVAFGGIAVRVPREELAALRRTPGVVAVYRDELRRLETDSSPAFIGATAAWRSLGGPRKAGEGAILADLDSGVWPEHPSLADPGDLAPVPPRVDGTERTCNFGDNPLTPETDVFQCNRKLIGGKPFLATYNAVVGDEVYPDSARDSNGHGTHTTTTAAGTPVAHAPVFGVDRGPATGIAPGAKVLAYKVCGLAGCFSSDSIGGVEQAIADGADIINYSISGGTDPLNDAVELAFLDAYDAGILVSASAGNEGPGAGTVNHNSPWVITVAASTQTRAFVSDVTLAAGGATLTVSGASVMGGLATPTPVVDAAAVAGYEDAQCTTAPPAGTFAGKVVVCARGGNGRVAKGVNVKAGGAVAMILRNTVVQDTETDNHFLPAVHLDGVEGDQLMAFLTAHPDATATFTAGQKRAGQGDVVAGFSSRGPGGTWLKPDITAPGVQILAGNTPTPDEEAGGPAGEYFQAIAGTSMSAPHIAGSALLVAAAHPTWTPGQIKSALMTTATRDVVKEDTTTPADPFDVGSGRVRVNRALDPGVTFDASTANILANAGDPLTAIDVNTPSINAPLLPGIDTTTRTLRNVSRRRLVLDLSATTGAAGARITVEPSRLVVRRGAEASFRVTIDARGVAAGTQGFGTVFVREVGRGQRYNTRLPVGFKTGQGAIALDQACDRTSLPKRPRDLRATCTVTATNVSFAPADLTARTTVRGALAIDTVTGATRLHRKAAVKRAQLAGGTLSVPAIAPTEDGFVDLVAEGFAPTALGDEGIENVDLGFEVRYAGRGYGTVGVTSNGYLVLGGGDSQDVSFSPAKVPSAARPNALLAPFWSDLNDDDIDASGDRYGYSIAVGGDPGDEFAVIQWTTHVWGDEDAKRTFQVWLFEGLELATFDYAPATLGQPGEPSVGLEVGAENQDGSGGAGLGTNVAPTGSLAVTWTEPVAGESMSYEVRLRADGRGAGLVETAVVSPAVRGTTVVRDRIDVTG